MKINFIDKRSEDRYYVSAETDNGVCYCFDLDHEPTEAEIEEILNQYTAEVPQ